MVVKYFGPVPLIARLIALIALAASLDIRKCEAQVPNFVRDSQPSCKSFAEAVNYYVSLGEVKAVIELNDATKESRPLDLASRRVCFVCRILFEPRGKAGLEPPALGSLNLPTESMPMATWPYYPCAKVGKSIFLLNEDYCLAGVPIRASEYIEYCRKRGAFRTHQVTVPTRGEALGDIETLRHSEAWKQIEWSEISERRAYEYLMRQATTIPRGNRKGR
jgi:hypothetical protein